MTQHAKANQSPYRVYSVGSRDSVELTLATITREPRFGPICLTLPNRSISAESPVFAAINIDLPCSHRAKDAACQMQIQQAGTPKPAIIRERHQASHAEATQIQFNKLTPNQMRHRVFETDVRREVDSIDLE